MSEQKPTLTDKAKKAQEDKAKRLADALRANLHRRKAQSRARQDETNAEPEDSGD